MALTHSRTQYSEEYHSFVNGQNTTQGGTHLSAFREGYVKTIREFFGKLIDWKKLDDLIPKNFKNGSKYKRTGKAGIFAGSLELVKEGNLTMKQDKLFDDIYVKENND